ncbi:putative Serine acetyltransferase [Nitrospira defluvii]|uniref:Putative Serine acetyltransferase n=1 Tax=Nitrospira defluvii TaxID=330214 RepID=D8PFS1_9BACT|nr:putative Serine acetyltransferase [Nitrospira defluvii]
MNAITPCKLARRLYLSRIPVLPKLIYYLMFLVYNSSIPFKAEIGRGTRFGYGGMGVVIHERSRIGEDCIISQQVTIGGRAGHINPPRVGNRVYVGAGAKLIGDIDIGDECVIGTNSVVMQNVPNRSVVAGIPARVIKSNIDITYYMKHAE